MQIITSILSDENGLPLISMLDNHGIVHMCSSIDSHVIFTVTYQDYLAMKQWMNI